MESPRSEFENDGWEIADFIEISDPEERGGLIAQIATILSTTDDSFNAQVHEDDMLAYGSKAMIENIRKAIKMGQINSKARWLPTLNKQLLRFEIYMSDSTRDLEKGRKELEGETSI